MKKPYVTGRLTDWSAMHILCGTGTGQQTYLLSIHLYCLLLSLYYYCVVCVAVAGIQCCI